MCDIYFCRTLFLTLEVVNACVAAGFLYTGVFLLTDTNPTLIMVNSCEQEIKRVAIPKAGYAFCVFGGMLLLTSLLGFRGVTGKRAKLLRAYTVILYILLTVEALFLIFFYLHLRQILDKLPKCLQKLVPQKYSGPWKTDVSSFSHALDKTQFEKRCCGVADLKVFQSFEGWNKTRWDIPASDFEHVRNSSLRQPPRLAVPWTCCRTRAASPGAYDPTITLKKLSALLVDMACTYRVSPETVNVRPCLPHWQQDLSRSSTVFIYLANALNAFNVLRLLAGVYNARACRYLKDKKE